MAKIVYKFDGTDDFTVDSVADDYQLKDGETFDQPAYDALSPFSFVDGKIVGSSTEQHAEYLKKKQSIPVGEESTPNQTMAAINALGIQVAQLTAKVEAQAGGVK